MSRSIWLVALIKKTFSGRFTLARTTGLPVIGGIVDRLFFRDDRMGEAVAIVSSSADIS